MTGNIITGYVRNNPNERQNWTSRAKSKESFDSCGIFVVMISLVSGPNDRYPQVPNDIYKKVTHDIVMTNSLLKDDRM